MCGIAGFVPKKKEVTNRDYRVLMQLTIENESRGSHSTGISLMKKSGNMKIYKGAEAASILVPKHADKYEKGLRSIITHTRYATVGKTTKKNAHPFNYGSVTGVHNGSVENYLKISEHVDVDSQVIFQQLAKYNNNFKKVFKKLLGEFAIAWQYKKEPEAVYIVRKDNPLFLVETAGGYFFSSQKVLLSILFFDQDVAIKKIKENRVIRISPKGLKYFKIKFKKEVVRNVKPSRKLNKSYYLTWKNNRSYYDSDYDDSKYISPYSQSSQDSLPFGGSDTNKTERFDEDTRRECNLCSADFYFTRASYEKCDGCGAPGKFRDRMYTNTDFFLCESCLFSLVESENEKQDEKTEELQKWREEIYKY